MEGMGVTNSIIGGIVTPSHLHCYLEASPSIVCIGQCVDTGMHSGAHLPRICIGEDDVGVTIDNQLGAK